MLPDELPEEPATELEEVVLLAGLLYEGVEARPAAELALLVRLPTLMPPLLVPVLGLATDDGLLAVLWLVETEP